MGTHIAIADSEITDFTDRAGRMPEELEETCRTYT